MLIELVWLGVGALVPLLAYSIIPWRDKPSFLLLIALGIGGAALGGPLGDMFRPLADEVGITPIVGAIVGALVALVAYRQLVKTLTTPDGHEDPFDAPIRSSIGTNGR